MEAVAERDLRASRGMDVMPDATPVRLAVDDEFERLAKAVEFSHDIFEALMSRLESVRVGRPVDPDAVKLEASPEAPRSELAGKIAYQADRVEQLIRRMRGVIDELDL